MIGISVTNFNDLNLTKELIRYLDKKDIFVNFENELLKDNFGILDFKYGSDVEYLLMHSHNFDLFITFSSPPNPAQIYNFRLVSFFNELGVQTVEFQHGLFQYGYNLLDDFNKCGFNKDINRLEQEGWGLPLMYPAKNFVSWIGEEGIGYLKSNKENTSLPFDKDFTLLVTNNNWHIYTEFDRVNLVNALVKLIELNKNDFFVLKPHPAEYKIDEFYNLMESYQLENLYIFKRDSIKDISSDDLIKNAKYGISMVSTSLIDFDFSNVPTLVYLRDINKKMIDTLISVETFTNADELIEKYKLLKLGNTKKLKTGVNKLNPDYLVSKLESIRKKSSITFNARLILDYLNIINLEKKINNIKEVKVDNPNSFNKIIDDMGKVYERLIIIQRSTFGFKMKKLMKKWGIK